MDMPGVGMEFDSKFVVDPDVTGDEPSLMTATQNAINRTKELSEAAMNSVLALERVHSMILKDASEVKDVYFCASQKVPMSRIVEAPDAHYAMIPPLIVKWNGSDWVLAPDGLSMSGQMMMQEGRAY